jgi:hypothetical protein
MQRYLHGFSGHRFSGHGRILGDRYLRNTGQTYNVMTEVTTLGRGCLGQVTTNQSEKHGSLDPVQPIRVYSMCSVYSVPEQTEQTEQIGLSTRKALARQRQQHLDSLLYR